MCSICYEPDPGVLEIAYVIDTSLARGNALVIRMDRVSWLASLVQCRTERTQARRPQEASFIH